MPDGIDVSEVYTQKDRLRDIAFAEYDIEFRHVCLSESDGADLVGTVRDMFAVPVVLMKRSKRGEREVDISPLVKSISALHEGDLLTVRTLISASGENYLNPEYVARAVSDRYGLTGDGIYHVIRRRRLLLDDAESDFR